MSFKFIKKYFEETCDICNENDWGYFAIINRKQICSECLEKIGKSYTMIEIDKKGIKPFDS